jgi:hypothetical protein
MIFFLLNKENLHFFMVPEYLSEQSFHRMATIRVFNFLMINDIIIYAFVAKAPRTRCKPILGSMLFS